MSQFSRDTDVLTSPYTPCHALSCHSFQEMAQFVLFVEDNLIVVLLSYKVPEER